MIIQLIHKIFNGLNLAINGVEPEISVHLINLNWKLMYVRIIYLCLCVRGWVGVCVWVGVWVWVWVWVCLYVRSRSTDDTHVAL